MKPATLAKPATLGGSTPAANQESTLAVLFADVCDSTRLYESLGDREALRMVGACLAVMRAAAEHSGGRVVKTIGDELMCAFKDATSAALAAEDMQHAVNDHHAPLAVRIGFDWGPVIEEAGDLFGDTVNVAARMAQLAQSGQILATARALGALPAYIGDTSRPLTGITVKGKNQELEIGEIVWEYRDDLTMVSDWQRAEDEDAADAARRPKPRLRLVHASGELMVGEGDGEIRFGRGADCNIPIRDLKASRLHASIERRRDKFVLIDRSSNGTFVLLDDNREIRLKREEFTLSGGGVLGFGQNPNAPGADTVFFSCE